MTDYDPKTSLPHDQSQEPPPDDTGTTKRRRPRWVIGAVIAGVVLLITIVIVVIVVNAPQPEDCSAPDSCGQELPPTPSAEVSQDTVIPLDSNAGFENPSAWGVLSLAEWETIPVEEEGGKGVGNSRLDCTFFSAQDSQPVDRTSSSDLPSTTRIVDKVSDSMKALDPNREVVSEDSIRLALNKTGSGEFIEFATITMDYSVDEGDYRSIFLTRSMPHSGSYMLAQLDCPRAVFDGENSPLQKVIDTLVVIPEP